jgi:hypothetical protein
MNPHYHLHPSPRAIPAVDVRAHYTLPGGLFIVAVVHQRRHRPPPPPSLSSRGWLLLGAACRHLHPHHCRPRPTQPYQRRRPHRLASSSSPPCDPPPPVAFALSPPSQSPMALSWTGMRCQCPPSRSNVASAAPARTPLVVIRAHCASAVIMTATIPRSPLRRPAVDPPSLLGPPPLVG